MKENEWWKAGHMDQERRITWLARKYKYGREEYEYEENLYMEILPGGMVYRGNKKLTPDENQKLVEVIKEFHGRELRATAEREENKFLIVDEDIEVTEEKRKFLNLGLKFRMTSGVNLHRAEVEVEKWCVKNRWTLQEKEERDGLTEDEIKRTEAAEAEAVRAQDQDNKILDLRKLRVTALPTCTRIFFPEPHKTEENKIQIQKELVLNTIKNYKTNNQPKSGNNLTLEEETGYIQLKRRIEDERLVVFPTDKSGRTAIMKLETYLRMSEVHTSKDKKAG